MYKYSFTSALNKERIVAQMPSESPLVYAEMVDGLSPPDSAAGARWVGEKDVTSWC